MEILKISNLVFVILTIFLAYNLYSQEQLYKKQIENLHKEYQEQLSKKDDIISKNEAYIYEIQYSNKILTDKLDSLQKAFEQYKQNLSLNLIKCEAELNTYKTELNNSKRIISELKAELEKWNITKWFKDNKISYNIYNHYLTDCITIGELNIPCLAYNIRNRNNYDRRIEEMYSLKRFIEQGAGTCREFSLFIAYILKNLKEMNFDIKLKAMEKSNDQRFYIKGNLYIENFQGINLAHISNYYYGVICYNQKDSGHCGVLISADKISNESKFGIVLDPFTGAYLGSLNKNIKLCSSTCGYMEAPVIIDIEEEKFYIWSNGSWQIYS